VSLVCDPEPEAEIDENVEESDQQEVRFNLIDRNRVFEHLKISTSVFLPDSFYLK
jgi:hypothetical protein